MRRDVLSTPANILLLGCLAHWVGRQRYTTMGLGIQSSYTQPRTLTWMRRQLVLLYAKRVSVPAQSLM